MSRDAITPEEREWIKKASDDELLRRWRYSPAGSSWFVGKCGEFYEQEIERRRLARPGDMVDASKRVGWGAKETSAGE